MLRAPQATVGGPHTPSAATTLPRALEHRGLVASLQNDQIVLEALTPVAPRFPMPPPLVLRTPSDSEVAWIMAQARSMRQRDLRNLMLGGPLSRGPKPSLKDGSARVDYFFTRCVGTGAKLISELAAVGSREGFRLAVESDDLDSYGIDPDVHRFIDKLSLPAYFRDGGGERGEILGRRIPKLCTPWTEDDGEIAADGVNIPAASHDHNANDAAIALDRERRAFDFFDMDSVGQVAIEFRQYFKVRLALSMQPPLPVREAMSHVEGGNMLPFRRLDGDTALLVGADSFAATIESIARSCGVRFPTQDAKFNALQRPAKIAIAADYDLRSPNHVVVAAQAAYHLDVHAFANGGHIVIDDPDEAADVELDWEAFKATKPKAPGVRSMSTSDRYQIDLNEWMEEHDELAAYTDVVYERSARRSAKLEPFVNDLRIADIPMTSFGGRFYKDADKYNAISQENGTNPAGERYVILANTFIKEIRDHVLMYYLKRAPAPYARVYLLDAPAARDTHRFGGDISCFCKARTAPHSQLPSIDAVMTRTGTST